MTKLLERAVDAARSLEPEMQDEVARVVLALTGHDDGMVELSDAEIASLAPSREQARLGRLSSDEDVQLIWSKHGL